MGCLVGGNEVGGGGDGCGMVGGNVDRGGLIGLIAGGTVTGPRDGVLVVVVGTGLGKDGRAVVGSSVSVVGVVVGLVVGTCVKNVVGFVVGLVVGLVVGTEVRKTDGDVA